MVVDVKNDCPDVLENIKSSLELAVDKIRKNAIDRADCEATTLHDEPITTESILSERQAQYGNYSDVARITQEIKKSLLSGASYSNLSDEQKLSLDMIANKMARAVNGDVTYVDNWQDICGYSQLVVDSLNS